MPDATDPAAPTEPVTPDPAAPADASTPPWGADFDAERAWTLVQALRADVAKAKATGQAPATPAKPADPAPATPPAPADPDALTAAEARAVAAERELHVERARRKFPDLGDDLVEFLTGTTEDAILAQAERLAKVGAAPSAPTTDPTTGKPVPALTPGHSADESTAFDAAAVTAAIKAKR